jgi:hypothetical protein
VDVNASLSSSSAALMRRYAAGCTGVTGVRARPGLSPSKTKTTAARGGAGSGRCGASTSASRLGREISALMGSSSAGCAHITGMKILHMAAK